MSTVQVTCNKIGGVVLGAVDVQCGRREGVRGEGQLPLRLGRPLVPIRSLECQRLGLYTQATFISALSAEE